MSKAAVAELGPATLSWSRYAVAAAVLAALALARGQSWQGLWRREHAVCGATGVALFIGLQNVGLQISSAGTAALLQAVLPVLTLVVAAAWLRERAGSAQLAGTALVVGGVALTVTGGVGGPTVGDAAILAGLAFYAAYTVYLRRYLATADDADVAGVAAGSALYGLVLLSPWLLWECAVQGIPRPSAQAVLAAGYLGVAASAAALVLWAIGLRAVSASVAGAFTGAIPALGYVFAVAAGEPLSWAALAGGAAALAGVVLASAAPSSPPDHEAPDVLAPAVAEFSLPPGISAPALVEPELHAPELKQVIRGEDVGAGLAQVRVPA